MENKPNIWEETFRGVGYFKTAKGYWGFDRNPHRGTWKQYTTWEEELILLRSMLDTCGSEISIDEQGKIMRGIIERMIFGNVVRKDWYRWN